MKTRLLPLLFLIVSCLFLSGCPSFSSHPLYTDQDAVMEPSLEGKWGGSSGDNEVVLFQKSDDHAYSLSVFDPDKNARQNYDVHLVRLGGQLFMDLIFKGQTVGDVKVDDPLGVVSAHVIAKVRVSGDDFAYAILEGDLIRKQSTLGRPLPHCELADGLLVTTKTEDLRRYIAAHVDDVFAAFEHLHRR